MSLFQKDHWAHIRGLRRDVDALKNRTRGYTTVQDTGTAVTVRDTINFTGATVTDDPTNNVTNVAVSGGGGTAGEPPPFQPTPLLAISDGQLTDYGGHWGINPDTASLGGATFTNGITHSFGSARTAAINDYVTFPVMLGPKGSAWSCICNFKLQSNGGIFKIRVGSVVDTAGELADPSSVTYLHPLDLNGTAYLDDTYQGVTSYDGYSFSFSQCLVIGGNDGDAFTAVTGTDAHTGYPIINGGAGSYRFKVDVTSKFLSSSGYRVDLMNMAWVRVDRTGYY